MEDLEETTARIHTLLDAEAALATGPQQQPTDEVVDA